MNENHIEFGRSFTPSTLRALKSLEHIREVNISAQLGQRVRADFILHLQ